MKKKIRLYMATAMAGVILSSVSGCDLIERTDSSKGKTVLAKVGKKKITKSDVDKGLKTYLDQYKEQYGDNFESEESLKETLKQMRQQQLNNLIEKEVLMQNKDALNVNPTDEEVQSEVDERIKYYKDSIGSEDQYESFIQSYGYDDDSFAEMMKENVILGMIVDALFTDIEVSDDEIENYYNENIDQYTLKPGANVTHLLFQPEKDQDGNVADGAKEAAKALADKAREQAVAGTSLEDLSNKDEFKDKCMYENLGRVSFEESGMVQEFEDAFKNLPANQVSDVVETSYGYHIIVNTEIFPNEEKEALDDELKETIKNTLLSQKQQDEYDSRMEKMKEDLKVKVYDDRL